MRRAMKKSRVKEGILNLTKGNEIDKTNDLILDVKDKIEVLYEKNGKIKSKKLKVKQLLKRLSHDVNIYFPIVEHRKRVLEEGEPFWVAFNPPDHDKSEYFVRAFNQFGEDSLISSKVGMEENLLVIAYSENQENYSTALATLEPPDCLEYELYGEPCFPNEPNPDPLPDPTPVETEEGIQFLKFKTKNINDGFLDGDLEIQYSITQSYAKFNIDSDNVGISVGANALDYINREADYNAGHWYWYWYELRFRNNNNWLNVYALRRFSDRQKYVDINGVFGIPNITVYNNLFTLTIREDDGLYGRTTYINEDYNFNTFNFNIERALYVDGGIFYYVIEKKQFPKTSF